MKKAYWTNNDWITKLNGDICTTQEEARTSFCNLVADMDGVSIIDSKHGVKLIEVKSKTKVYHYEVHAHSISVVVGYEAFDDGFDDEPTMVEVYENKWYATVGKNVFNAYIEY